MNGPEHYQRAEELLERASRTRHGHPVDADGMRMSQATRTAMLAAAQAHATLALAAATTAAKAGTVLISPDREAPPSWADAVNANVTRGTV